MNIINTIEKKHIQDVAERISKDAKDETIVDNNKLNIFLDRGKSFNIGDLVKVHYKIIEGKRERIQVYEGYVIGMKGKGLSRTFKVRKISYSVGVERTFPLYSPNIANIELVRRGKIRRAKLYYLRDRSGKSALIREKINFKNKEGAAKK